MLKSMTGYGKATLFFQKKELSVEMRSLNSKQLDINLKLPSHYKEKEMDLRNLLAKEMHRGKVEAILKIGNETSASTKINSAVVKDYFLQLKNIGKQLGYDIHQEPVLQTIMRFPEVLVPEEEAIEDAEWEAVQNVFKKAINELQLFRAQEGAALEKDMLLHIEQIENLLEKIPEFENQRVETIRDRLNENFKLHLNESVVERDRFEQEIIYYLEKFDISEEKVRLKNHCQYFREITQSTEPAGKKLAFVSQEIGREINTLGSKANHTEIQRIVVQMKDALEKIKEQMLNVL